MKTELTAHTVLSLYDPQADTKISADASSHGQGRIQDFSRGSLEAMVIYKVYYIYCNYYFKRSALYPTESYRCMNLLAAVPAAQQLYS